MRTVLVAVACIPVAERAWAAAAAERPPTYDYLENFAAPNPRTAVGEIGNLYIVPPGLYLSPMNNDFLGGTDKLMSGSINAGLLRTFSRSSYLLGVSWRFVTPVYKRAFGEADLSTPIGRFADWGEAYASYAQVEHHWGLHWKHQVTVGLSHVGDKGAREVHVFIHQLSANSTKQLSYRDQPAGFDPAYGYQLALLLPESRLLGIATGGALAGGITYNPQISDVYLAANWVMRYNRHLQLGLEAVSALQFNSEFYALPRRARFEVAAGFLLSRYYKVGFRWISPYLQPDAHGQVYAELLQVNIPF